MAFQKKLRVLIFITSQLEYGPQCFCVDPRFAQKLYREQYIRTCHSQLHRLELVVVGQKLTWRNYFRREVAKWSWTFGAMDFPILANSALKMTKFSSLAMMVSVWREQKWVLAFDENFESASSRCFRRNTMEILSSNKLLTNSVYGCEVDIFEEVESIEPLQSVPWIRKRCAQLQVYALSIACKFCAVLTWGAWQVFKDISVTGSQPLSERIIWSVWSNIEICGLESNTATKKYTIPCGHGQKSEVTIEKLKKQWI